MEHEQVVNYLSLESKRPRELARAMQRPPVSGQCYVEGEVAFSYSAGNRVVNRLPDDKVLEEVALGALRSQDPPP